MIMLQNQKIHQVITENNDKMIELRRELHQYPELSYKEVETTKRIAREMDALGIDYRLTQPTGLIADIKGNLPGKTILLRADMDGLPVQELNTHLPFVSKNDGVMHACGHDAHMSMLVSAARALVSVKDELKGTVRFVFQPAEEAGTGALKMIEQGATEGVDNAFGIHIWSGTPTGQIACPVGEMLAAVDVVRIHFKGKGGHGSRPHEAIDALLMASAFVTNVQAVVSREVNPIDSAVVTMGKMESGDRYNVIAQDAVLEGTVRTFTPEIREQVAESVTRFAESIARQYRGSVEVDYQFVTEPVMNPEKDAKFVQQIVADCFGEEAIAHTDKSTIGEDFSYFTIKPDIPGAFAFVGTRNEKAGTTIEHHASTFNIDEESLKYGAELYAQYAFQYLNSFE